MVEHAVPLPPPLVVTVMFATTPTVTNVLRTTQRVYAKPSWREPAAKLSGVLTVAAAACASREPSAHSSTSWGVGVTVTVQVVPLLTVAPSTMLLTYVGVTMAVVRGSREIFELTVVW